LRDEADSLVERSLTDDPGGVLGFGEDAGGEVYVLSLDEGVSRLVGA
jgi:hypothetical protein